MNNKKNEKRNRIVWILALVGLITSTLCVAAGLKIRKLERELHPSAQQVGEELRTLNPRIKIFDTLEDAMECENMMVVGYASELGVGYYLKANENISVNLYYDGERTPMNVVKGEAFACKASVTQSGIYILEIDYKGYTFFSPFEFRNEGE